MPVMDNPFTCTNGHSFRANAKVRARCPDCGAMARRDFKEAAKPATEGKEPETKTDPNKKLEHPVILRQGKTPVVTHKPRSAAQLANDKRLSELRKQHAKPKTSRSSALNPRVANGLVKTRRVTRPSIPTVNKRPRRTAVAGQLKNFPGSKSKSFMDQVIDTFGFKIG